MIRWTWFALDGGFRCAVRPRHPSLVHAALVIGLLLGGTLLRGWNLASAPMWVDEAESAINALTILEHGLPVDRYLGQPIYENTLTLPFPESEEYEFRDSSYSDVGLAIYHGWLPLYSIAASLALAGVEPDLPSPAHRVRHSHAEILHRTHAARRPSVLYGAAFLILLYLAARQMFGRDAGLAALACGAVFSPAVIAARQARYYSATLALSAGCCWAIWRMIQRRRWRDFSLAGVFFALLFHTHLLVFLTVAILGALYSLPLLLDRTCWPRIALAAAIVLLGSVPWVLATGFLRQGLDLPSAFQLLRFPDDYLTYVARKWELAAVIASAAALLLGVQIFHRRLPARMTQPILEHRRALWFCLFWIVLGPLLFALLSPAASYFSPRITLSVLVPWILCVALATAALVRMVRPSAGSAWAAGVVLLLVAATGRFETTLPAPQSGDRWSYQLVDYLREQQFAPDTRFYSTPNGHLSLMFWTGLPVQSVAPVRREFLENYAGPVVLIEPGSRHVLPSTAQLRAIAARAGTPLSADEAARLVPKLRTQLTRDEVAEQVAQLQPQVEPPPFATQLRQWQRDEDRQWMEIMLQVEGNPIFHGWQLHNFNDWWPIFFYRFVDPQSRMHDKLNYAGRIRSARAVVLSFGPVVYHCPPLSEGGGRTEKAESGKRG